ncbi:DNA repair protein RecN [Ornithobacterium rhinotracheale]|uniref:DNA repair protein RecN n=1 Tax=Ornithobacterium rhinotracheale TaxID=28251 RepID=A0A410JRQ0_ORNRH|nr:DNA repair protein RecN [Ornithobacterium rhinotracheale]QAR30804.1 DNA repair protein RecN [Ornithobacterium rhinotracheale]
MLKHLSIHNYALINDLELNLEKGLSIITGETGAGKSILLGALRLVLGERADLKSIKNAEEKCVVEAVFDIKNLGLEPFFDEYDLDYEDETILRREILVSGKSRAFVNDVPTTLKVLEELSAHLIDVHSQFQTANIITQEFQYEWIDAVAKNQKLVAEFQQNLKILKHKNRELNEILAQQAEFQKEKDYYEFIFNELKSADLENLNPEELEQQQYLLENAEEVAGKLGQSIDLMSAEPSGILSLLNDLKAKSKVFADYFSNSDLASRIDSLEIEAKDIFTEIERYTQEVEPDPTALAIIQEKLNNYNNLLQKHHCANVEELRNLQIEIAQKLEQEANATEDVSALKNEIKALTKQLDNEAKTLHERREKVIPKIEKEVLDTLSVLGMQNAEIQIKLEPSTEFSPFGKENLTLLFTANKGTALKTLEKSVSGGERSRLMLAVKKSLALHKTLPTLILDEIDTGVSGKIAGEMGKIMKQMGENLQVISITHLPQVAAQGNTHYKVSKSEKEGITQTEIHMLNNDERLNEIAQMISGSNITEAAIAQAKALLA